MCRCVTGPTQTIIKMTRTFEHESEVHMAVGDWLELCRMYEMNADDESSGCGVYVNLVCLPNFHTYIRVQWRCPCSFSSSSAVHHFRECIIYLIIVVLSMYLLQVL